MTVQDLIKKLVSFQSDESNSKLFITSEDDWCDYLDWENLSEQDTDRLNDIISAADELLVTDQGQPNWDNINLVRKAGFDVHAGEKDSFGWLSGVIETKFGRIVFG